MKSAHEDIYPTVWLYGDVAVKLIEPVTTSDGYIYVSDNDASLEKKKI